MSNAADYDEIEGLSPKLNMEVKEVLRYRIMQQAIFAQEEQRRAMRECQEDPFVHFEAGTVKMLVHPFFYAYWEQRCPGCWQDPKFVEEFFRDNECVRVKCKSRKTSVSFAGMDVKAMMGAASQVSSKDSALFDFGSPSEYPVIVDRSGQAMAKKPEPKSEPVAAGGAA